MADEESKKEEVPAPEVQVHTVVAFSIKRFFRGLKEGMLGSIESNIGQIGKSLDTIKEIMRPGLTNIAHSINKPYVEPTLETDFLEKWNETENKEDIFDHISEKYREMLHSVPDRGHWRL